MHAGTHEWTHGQQVVSGRAESGDDVESTIVPDHEKRIVECDGGRKLNASDSIVAY